MTVSHQQEIRYSPFYLAESLYQRVYGTAQRRKKTDYALAYIIALSGSIMVLETLFSHVVCGVGTL